MSDAVERPLTPNVFARLAQATRFAITGVTPQSWFGPQQPLEPQAPPDVKGRQFDYAFGANLNYVPRAEGGIGFAELRALADALPLLRAVIETRKDQVSAQNFTVRPRARANLPDASARIDKSLAFLARPDRRRSFSDWLRMLLEDLLVIDAATIYPRYDRAGKLYALDVIDGATIKPLIGEDGRAPEPPDPAYQQVLHGVPAADFSADELLYLPRNVRAHRLYGMSPVEQVALTVNIALRREAATLEYYRAGSSPDAFATLPKEWTSDQIRQPVPGLFRRADERQFRAAADAEIHAIRLQADRSPPAAAEGPVRRMAGAGDLVRLLRPRHAFRRPGQPGDERDDAHAGDPGRPRAAENLDQERARPGSSGLHG